MLRVTATTFRKNLFEYLDHVSAGETVIILRNDAEVARLTGTSIQPWRGHMPKMTVLVDEAQLMEPLDDLWEAYS